MKKFFCFILALSMILVLASCGAPDANDTSVPATEGIPSTSAVDSEKVGDTSKAETDESTEKSAKSLVVYFSWSGNTRHVAESIREQTGSDIFEIVPKTPYTTDYDAVVDAAKIEQRNNARPEIKDSVPNFTDYDTVYVGFPNWWGDMPMILYTFFNTYDFSGKTVALFCTSGGSGLSNTVNEVKELEPNATVTKGLHIGSGKAANPDNAVKDWLEEIG